MQFIQSNYCKFYDFNFSQTLYWQCSRFNIFIFFFYNIWWNAHSHHFTYVIVLFENSLHNRSRSKDRVEFIFRTWLSTFFFVLIQCDLLTWQQFFFALLASFSSIFFSFKVPRNKLIFVHLLASIRFAMFTAMKNGACARKFKRG